MPSHKGDLKNTKTRKVKVVYNHLWEHEYQRLRKFLSSSRGRGSNYGSEPNTTLEMIEPGSWKFAAKIGWVSRDLFPAASSRHNPAPAYGRTPEEAFKNWWSANVDNRPEGWELYYTVDNRYGWVTPKKEVFKIMAVDDRTGRWAWLPILMYVQPKEVLA
jgi:hypothetical protein